MKVPLAVFLRAMNLRVKAVGAFRRSASFTSSAWRSQKTWTDLTAQLRADRINRPQIILSDEEEEDDSCVGMDESYTGLDEARLSSSSSAAAVCENPSKFKRPSSLTWKKELANSMSLIGTIDDNVRFKYTDSGKPLAWTSLHDEGKSFYSYASESALSQSLLLQNIAFGPLFTLTQDGSYLKDGLLYNWNKLCVPKGERLHLMGETHNSKLSRHFGVDKTMDYLQRVGLYFLDELANIANQHLRKNDYVHVSGELEQRESKIYSEPVG